MVEGIIHWKNSNFTWTFDNVTWKSGFCQSLFGKYQATSSLNLDEDKQFDLDNVSNKGTKDI